MIIIENSVDNEPVYRNEVLDGVALASAIKVSNTQVRKLQKDERTVQEIVCEKFRASNYEGNEVLFSKLELITKMSI